MFEIPFGACIVQSSSYLVSPVLSRAQPFSADAKVASVVTSHDKRLLNVGFSPNLLSSLSLARVTSTNRV